MKTRVQKGISLLEVLLVVLVAAGIVSGAITYYSQTLRASRVSQATSFLQQVTQASREWLQIPNGIGQYPKDFTGLTNGLTDLVNQQLLPCENNSCTNNSWGGQNTADGQASPPYLKVTIGQIPAADCALLQQEMANIAPSGPSSQNYCQTILGSHTANYQVYL